MESIPEETQGTAFATQMKRVGLIINPIAGMGGAAGLKGTDGVHVLQEAIARGAKPKSEDRTREALEVLEPLRNEIRIVTCPDHMGENVVRSLGFSVEVIGNTSNKTTSEDTRKGANLISTIGVDVLLFAGGDGTAADIYESIGDSLVTIGIPTGVKIHSAVFSTSPRGAGELALLYLEGRVRKTIKAEVMDVDENEFRKGKLSTRLLGYLRVPWMRPLLQGGKISSSVSSEEYYQEAIAEEVADNLEGGRCYVVGPGTTTKAIMRKFNLDYSLLGVDIIDVKGRDERKATLIGRDLSESEILGSIEGRDASLIVSPIGGQGFLFGRGNQQISDVVIDKIGRRNITIVSTPNKIEQLKGNPFLIDTGSKRVDKLLSGYYRVITGYKEYITYRAIPG